MPNFDYITSTDFRIALSSDYDEMQRCAEAGAWKSAQVVAGSIVECLLVDYLTSTTNESRPNKDPLKVDLADAVAICKSEGVLSDRTADLCSVVRSYRNLIHPGRMVRLGEQPPSKTTCGIAIGLIELIVEEIAKKRRASVGLTAEQILSKIRRDAGCLPILKHLLSEVNESQRERLLLELIPSAYFDALALASSDRFDYFDDECPRLAEAYRMILDVGPDGVKKKVAQEFVRVLREEDGDRVSAYRDAFFRASDLASITTDTNRAMVKEHLLGMVETTHTAMSLRVINGITAYLTKVDVNKWLDPLARTVVSQTAKDNIKQKARNEVVGAIFDTTSEVELQIIARLKNWIRTYEERQLGEAAEIAKGLLLDVEGTVPF